MEGTFFSHYEVLEKLGHGGMGVVYKARDLRLQRLVALKVLAGGQAADTVSRKRFLREAQAASALNHPHIVTIYDIDQHEGSDFIAMEYLDGKPLNQLIRRKGVPAPDALHYGLQIAGAVGAAHHAGIVHRDLKPGNAVVAKSGLLKVLDFGLAKWESGDEGGVTRSMALTNEGVVFGTVAYMAPEQALGAPVDHRADIFSFGIMLQEMLTGQLPFQAAHALALLHEVQYGEPRRLRELRPDLPQELEALILQALEKEPGSRVQSMEEMAQRMEEAAALLSEATPSSATITVPVTVATGSAAARRRSSVQRALTRPPAPGSERASIAVLPFSSLSSDPDDAFMAAGIASEIISALTGVPGLRVASHLASFRFNEAAPDLEQVAAQLNVRYVMTGSLRRAGSRIRVLAQLADSADGAMIWSHSYQRDIEDLFAVQADIANAIVGATGGQILRTGTEHASRAPAESLDAWGLVRKAYHFWTYAFRLEGVEESLNLLRRAIGIDPQYAAAHAYLGFYLVQRLVLFLSADRPADRAEALAAAGRALELAPADPEVLEAVGVVYLDCGHWDKAVQSLRRAVQIAPFNLVAWGYLGLALGWGGDSDQVAEARRILDQLIENTPDHPSLPYWYYFKSGVCVRQERFDEAAECGRRSTELQPLFIIAQVAHANALGQLGRSAEARALMSKVTAVNPGITEEAYMDSLLSVVPDPERAAPHAAGLRRAGVFREK